MRKMYKDNKISGESHDFIHEHKTARQAEEHSAQGPI